jgi:hypothetical protein
MITFQYRAVLCLLIVCSITLLSVSPLFGQAATASISGRVTDATGASIPSAPVTIRNTGTSASQTVNTDNQAATPCQICPSEVTSCRLQKWDFRLPSAQESP